MAIEIKSRWDGKVLYTAEQLELLQSLPRDGSEIPVTDENANDLDGLYPFVVMSLDAAWIDTPGLTLLATLDARTQPTPEAGLREAAEAARDDIANVITEFSYKQTKEIIAALDYVVDNLAAALSASPSLPEPGDLISRSALLKEISSWNGYYTSEAGWVLDRSCVIDEIEDFPAAHPLPERPGNWRPIETAPKDGSVILVCQRPSWNRVTLSGARIARWAGGAESQWVDSEGRASLHEWTDWMPLPEPPASTPEGAEQ